jgi:outer membrane protein OmpA-like peptidoglycan-associated protein
VLGERVHTVEGATSQAARRAESSDQRASHAALQAQLAQDIALGNVRREEVRRSTVYFDFDSAALSPEAQSELAGVAADLRAHVNYLAVLVGYTDSTGDDEYNAGLAQRRAAAVQRQLATDLGTEIVRVAYVGLGEIQPVAENETREGRKQNRRVEIVLVRPLPGTGNVENPPTAAR